MPHPHISSDILTPSGATPNAYKITSLIKFLTTRARQPLHPKLSPYQSRFLASKPTCARTSNALHSLISEMLPILDYCFFGGSLLKVLKAVWFYGDPLKKSQDVDAGHGKYLNSRGYFHQKSGIIWLNISMLQRARGSMTEQYTAALLHEMIHAFFYFYACRCEESCRELRWCWIGCGHGNAWLDVAVEMERCWAREVEWDVDLGVRQALEQEVRDSQGGWKPTGENLRVWGLRKGERKGEFEVDDGRQEGGRRFWKW